MLHRIKIGGQCKNVNVNVNVVSVGLNLSIISLYMMITTLEAHPKIVHVTSLHV